MIQVILSVLFIVLTIFVEPLIYLPFGISIFLIIAILLYSRTLSSGSIIFLIVASILLDLTVKNMLGSYLVVFSIIVLVSEISKRVASIGSILSILIRVVSIYLSLILLNMIYTNGFSNQLLIENILPAIITYAVVIIVETLLSNFNSDSNLSKIKL
jgi:hypothetical protein